ncbi:MAG: nickel-responsive transcriptional regulator NikR [Actinobacteria bacterium]|nr:nickel-responsive transcriptional regulator NikR [Actinomycetota bacterium]
MSSLTRFGMSLDSTLLDRFDKLISRTGQKNRSEAIRDLIRDALVRYDWKQERGEKVGTITLIYDHHAGDISEKMTELEHHYHQIVISQMHIHLDHDNCLEVLAVRGEAAEIYKIANELIGMKGVKHGKLVATTSGKNLK